MSKQKYLRNIHECITGIPSEATMNDVNDFTRQELDQFAQQHGGEVWLGRVNLYDNHTADLWPYKPGDKLYNFGADFAVPKNDKELVRLIDERAQGSYLRVAEVYPKIIRIYERMEAIGGIHLFWV